jgi:hypothetical protein
MRETKMTIKKLLLTAAAAAILATTGASARDFDRDGRSDHSWSERHDRDGYRDGYMDRQHDRYWRQGYRSYADRDVVFRTLRYNHFYRWSGDPYWFQGRYVMRTYDGFGRVVLVEINPYTGGFVGVVRF